MLAILSVTSEWSQRTALMTFALVPQRRRVIAAKLLAAVVVAAAAVLVCLVVAALGAVAAPAFGGTADVWSLEPVRLVEAFAFQLIGMLLGAAFGLVLLSSAPAIVLYFVLPTAWAILAGLVGALQEVGEWLDMGVTLTPLVEGGADADAWARVAATAVLWVLAPLLAGLLRVRNREVS